MFLTLTDFLSPTTTNAVEFSVALATTLETKDNRKSGVRQLFLWPWETFLGHTAGPVAAKIRRHYTPLTSLWRFVSFGKLTRTFFLSVVPCSIQVLTPRPCFGFNLLREPMHNRGSREVFRLPNERDHRAHITYD